jgi:hypothetical protein
MGMANQICHSQDMYDGPNSSGHNHHHSHGTYIPVLVPRRPTTAYPRSRVSNPTNGPYINASIRGQGTAPSYHNNSAENHDPRTLSVRRHADSVHQEQYPGPLSHAYNSSSSTRSHATEASSSQQKSDFMHGPHAMHSSGKSNNNSESSHDTSMRPSQLPDSTTGANVHSGSVGMMMHGLPVKEGVDVVRHSQVCMC